MNTMPTTVIIIIIIIIITTTHREGESLREGLEDGQVDPVRVLQVACMHHQDTELRRFELFPRRRVIRSPANEAPGHPVSRSRGVC
jgi:hypothetical protein